MIITLPQKWKSQIATSIFIIFMNKKFAIVKIIRYVCRNIKTICVCLKYVVFMEL